MGDRSGKADELDGQLRQMHAAAVEVIEKNRAFRSLVIPMLQAANESDEARRLFECLVELKEASRRLAAATDAVRTEIRSVGIESGWEVEFAGGVEPGIHLILSRYARRKFAEGALATVIDEPQWRQLVRAEDFKQGGALHESLYVTTGLSTDDERTMLALEREDLALRRALSAGQSDSSARQPAGSVILNHRVRRVDLPNGGGSYKLTARQMDYVVLCALAKRQNAWYQTDDFKKQGGLGNPSELLRRLPDEVRSLIEEGKNGRRLLNDVQVADPVALDCGRVIDWLSLQVGDGPKWKA